MILCILLLISLTTVVNSNSVYPNSPCFLLFRNVATGKETRQCGNYAQFMISALPEKPEDAVPFKLHSYTTRTKYVCPHGNRIPLLFDTSLNGSIVPLLYRQNMCATVLPPQRDFVTDNSTSLKPTEIMRRKVDEVGGGAALFLVEKGKENAKHYKDYLFFDFMDLEIIPAEGIPTFYMYNQQFDDAIAELGGDYESIEVLAYRPKDQAYLALIMQMALAFGSVLAGSLWTIFSKRMSPEKQIETYMKLRKEKRRKKEEEAQISAASDTSEESGDKKNSAARRFYRNNKEAIQTVVSTLAPLISIVIFATLIILFRSFMLILLNLGMCIYAAVATATIVRSLVSNCSVQLSKSRILLAIAFCTALVGCLFWFYNRRSPYAFIQLNAMNCLTAAFLMYSVNFVKLKIPCYLLMLLFVYDIVMVFGTRAFFECSLMEQMAIGGCGKKQPNLTYVPPPYMFKYEPIMPAILQVPRISPMFPCFDVEVEKHFPLSILGLGDVIIPGFFICYCFRMIGIDRSSRIIYGSIGLLGYIVGLAIAMLIVLFVQSAQPALLYLVPCVLLPVILVIFLRGDLPVAWNGIDAIELPSDIPDEDQETSTSSDGAAV